MVLWQAVAALSSGIGTIILAAAAWIALRQWRESLSTRQIQGTMALIDQFQSSSVRGAKRFLERHRTEIVRILDEPRFLDKLDKFIRENRDEDEPRSLVDLRKSLAVLEFISVLCLNDQLPYHVECSYLAPSLAHYWYVAEPLITAIRAQRGNEIYLHHLGALVDLLRNGSFFRNPSKAKKHALRVLEDRAKAATLKDFKQMTSERPAIREAASCSLGRGPVGTSPANLEMGRTRQPEA